jgi:molybdopterin synthase catalytic subunit
MQAKILTFGILKSAFSVSSVNLSDGATVADLIAVLRRDLEERSLDADLLKGIAISVNAEYAQTSQLLRDGDVVGLLPPVSGGAPEASQPIVTYLTQEAIPTSALMEAIKHPGDGALASFDGIVRDHTRTRRTLYLDYEAYEEMAVTQMRQLAGQAIERFGVRAVTIVHRLGRLRISETSVLILVASAHRAPALDACRWLIDTLKRTVPIWKKETFEDGAVWADGEPFPETIALDVTDEPGILP